MTGSLVNVERLLDEALTAAMRYSMTDSTVRVDEAGDAVRLLLDVARSAWRDKEMNALLAFDASLAEEKS